jgi:hypothetical protein
MPYFSFFLGLGFGLVAAAVVTRLQWVATGVG